MFLVTFQKTANPNIIYQEEHEMKKLLALTLAAVMTLALLAGCGGKDGGSTPRHQRPRHQRPRRGRQYHRSR